MSLLNITNDGLPNILAQLHATVLRASKPIPRDELLETVAPSAVVGDGGKMARQTLNRWTQLGLFNEVNGEIDVTKRPEGRLSNPHQMMAFTRRTACAHVVARENNPEFWASEGALAADLTRGLAWMLAQDIYRTAFGKFEEQESRQIRDQDRRLFVNSTRRSGLQFWARFLGFSKEAYADIDPTVAVRDVLPEILDEGEEMDAPQFVERLAGLLPVLDGGEWRQEVLDVVDSNELSRLRHDQLSTALSRAILNLRQSGELLLHVRSDLGAAITPTGVNGARNDLTFHWIARPKAGAAR
ncbi:protein DpdG [Paraburkholderia unamae]|uniref:Uncharacterized protein n=1 Tax=Paraburkholderia unamae TaxID=219649 RepID=A0ABX5KZ12_9BURK|nr:protein DpdG [Paraburkholderia unamae]PVX97690.1 hypothetical protein C7402_101404 [Paraburkholderia unamae]